MTKFRILGPVTVVADSEQPLRVGGPKPRTLLAVLIVADGRPVSAEQLITELWGDDPPASANTVLQVYVSGLRKLLGDRVRRTAAGYVLDVAPDELDATAFADLAESARRRAGADPATAAAGLADALRLWQGEPLSGAGDTPAVQAARVRLGEQRMAATEDRFECELAAGRHAQVVSELAELVAANPLRERLTGQLMLAYHRSGRPADAERAYDGYCTLSRAELDAEPPDRLTALAAAIRRRDPTLDPPAGLALPMPASRFIGRRRELDDLERQLGRTRLLTLTGPGGTGKTRLALQLVRDVGAAQHPDGVYFIELAGTADESAVTGRVAAAVGARELPGRPLGDSLVERLRYARAVLVLDNCEHVVDAVAGLATELLQGCTGLRLLATSREPLQVPGETVVPVGGLRLPAANAAYEEAIRSEALRLLAERGAAARSGFRIDRRTCAAAVAVVRRLDGLPLAIELAAARLRVLTLPELAQRLDRRLDLHTAEGRGLPPRHRTIRATIEWSHDLLDKDERALFRRLAVFAGGFTLEAAEQVGADPDAGRPRRPDEILDLLSRLVHRSLVVPDLDAGGTRYRMLETVAEYAAEQLTAAGEESAARERHAGWYRQRMARAPRFGTSGHDFWVEQVPAELDDLRAAMEWALGADPEAALEIATQLRWFWWWVAGQLTEGREWLRRALAAAGTEQTLPRADALHAAAVLSRVVGDLAESRRLTEQSLVALESRGDDRRLGSAHENLARTATVQGDLDTALEHAVAMQRHMARTGDDQWRGWAANNVGQVLRCQGRFEDAAALHREAVERSTRAGDHRGVGVSTCLLATVLARQQRPAEARRLFLDSLARFRELRAAEAQVDALEGLACLDVDAGRYADGLALLLVAERERRRLGVPLQNPDEIEAAGTALAAARAALDQQAIGRVTAAAAERSLSAAVDDLLG